MTQVTVSGCRWDSQIGVVTTETDCMTVRCRLKCAFLQPKVVAKILRRRAGIFLLRFALWLISLVANRTAFWRPFLFLFLKRNHHKQSIEIRPRAIEAHDIQMFVMREPDAKFRNEFSPFEFW